MPDLIAKSDIVALTNLNNLVEERKLKNGIAAAHLQIEKILGRTGYAAIYAAAPAFSGDATGLSALLTGYIKPLMAWRARQLAYLDMHAEADRGGVFTKSGEDYATVDAKTLSMLIANARDMADEYQDRLIQRLEDNKAVWTWYTTTVTGEERMTTQRQAGGFSFRRSAKQDAYRG